MGQRDEMDQLIQSAHVKPLNSTTNKQATRSSDRAAMMKSATVVDLKVIKKPNPKLKTND